MPPAGRSPRAEPPRLPLKDTTQSHPLTPHQVPGALRCVDHATAMHLRHQSPPPNQAFRAMSQSPDALGHREARPSPTHLAFISTTQYPACRAITWARVVLPSPGDPHSSATCSQGRRKCAATRTASQTLGVPGPTARAKSHPTKCGARGCCPALPLSPKNKSLPARGTNRE